MVQNLKVIRGIEKALNSVGAGSGGTRNISGTTHYHVELEKELSSLHQKESSLLFTSGYVANEAALSTLSKLIPGLVIFSDENNLKIDVCEKCHKCLGTSKAAQNSL